MSFVNIWIHAGWSTKNRKPIIQEEFRRLVHDHIFENARKKEILIDCVVGYLDPNDQSLSKVIQLIKGEASYWLNNQSYLKEKFEWQKEYFAVSLGDDDAKRVRNYIQNQYPITKPNHFKRFINNLLKSMDFILRAKANSFF